MIWQRGVFRRGEPSAALPPMPVGHLHVPYLPAPGGDGTSEQEHKNLRDRIVQWVRKIIAAALPFIGKK